MRRFTFLFVFQFCILSALSGLAQRGHEIQVQLGESFNKGVSTYTYAESGTRVHRFEFDQRHSSKFYAFSWRYPINGYLETGLYFSHSFDASVLLFEAESILFDSNDSSRRPPSNFFLGKTKLSSKNIELGIDVRVTVARFDKFKAYLTLSTGLQRISVIQEYGDILEVQDQGLKQDFLSTHLVDEDVHILGFGLGLSRLLNNGINIKILEVYGRAHPKKSLQLSSPVSIEIRTGVSYQFYKRK